MTKVVYLRPDYSTQEIYRIESRGENSWWVVCQPLSWDGIELPNSRHVKFAESEAEARAWLDAKLGEPVARALSA